MLRSSGRLARRKAYADSADQRIWTIRGLSSRWN